MGVSGGAGAVETCFYLFILMNCQDYDNTELQRLQYIYTIIHHTGIFITAVYYVWRIAVLLSLLLVEP